jgi:hypothetical protein
MSGSMPLLPCKGTAAHANSHATYSCERSFGHVHPDTRSCPPWHTAMSPWHMVMSILTHGHVTLTDGHVHPDTRSCPPWHTANLRLYRELTQPGQLSRYSDHAAGHMMRGSVPAGTKNYRRLQSVQTGSRAYTASGFFPGENWPGSESDLSPPYSYSVPPLFGSITWTSNCNLPLFHGDSLWRAVKHIYGITKFMVFCYGDFQEWT